MKNLARKLSPLFLIVFCAYPVGGTQAESVWKLVERAQAADPSLSFVDFIQPAHQHLYKPSETLAHQLRDEPESRSDHVQDFLTSIQAELVDEVDIMTGLFEESVFFRFKNESGVFDFSFSFVFKFHPEFPRSKDIGAFDFHLSMQRPVFHLVFSKQLNSQNQVIRRTLDRACFELNHRSLYMVWNDENLLPADIHFFIAPPVKPWIDIYGEAPPSINEKARRIGVAILDQGVDYNHPALARHFPRKESKDGKLKVTGFNFMDEQDEPMDLAYDPYPFHGTPVAGIIAEGNPAWLELLAYRVMTPAHILESMKQAVENGSRVINMSIEILEEHIDKAAFQELQAYMAEQTHIIFVSAAGNDAVNLDQHMIFPVRVSLPHHIVIGSHSENGDLSVFTDGFGAGGSNFSKNYVHFFGRGENRLSTAPGGIWQEFSGTSFAAPEFSRYAAQVFYHRPDWSGAQVVKELTRFLKPAPKLEGLGAYPGIFDRESFLKKYPASERPTP